MNRLTIILRNKHTTLAGVVAIVCFIGQIWLPQFAEKFNRTMEAALAYGMVMAGDARKEK